jgi:hypothetical protein
MYSKIDIILPPPIYLLLNNNSQLIDSVTQLADKIVEIYFYNEEDDLKAQWKRNYINKTLSTYLDYDDIMREFENARIELSAKKNAETEDGEDSTNDSWA